MNSLQVEKNIQKLVKNFSRESFIFDLLLAYGTPKATVTLLQKGKRNLSKQEGQIILKKKLFFQEVEGKNKDLHSIIDDLQKDKNTIKHNPRFIVVTDYKALLAVDLKTNETLDIKTKEIVKHFDFFLPWAGIEKHRSQSENPADRKAAERMAKLYDGILADKENRISSEKRVHDLNVFLARLLFCFFAEDTEIFKEGLFTNSIASHTQPNGEDLPKYLEKLFDVLNTKKENRKTDLPQFLKEFPYVNGGLFADKHWVPKSSFKARKIIIECGELDWKKINPDIFGSMIQAVVHPGQRGDLGMHYTSVSNIMKLIEPLFLNELQEEVERNKGKKKQLQKLLGRISKMKFFDPACGSGNFLIITYKELRNLEMKIIKELGNLSFSSINVSNFYGIEIDDFACQISKLSLYLAEHQMNVKFFKKFGRVLPTLPLKESGNIVKGNATRLDWEDVCPKGENDEIYILGNPPYLGSSMQNKEQKSDLAFVCEEFKNYKNLDYISCWFLKGSEYIKDINARLAFVSTNSICQGEQVALLWPCVLKNSLEIGFAHTSFKWKNNAKHNAGVIVVIIGLRNIFKKKKFLINNGCLTEVGNINAYLTAGKDIYLPRISKTISSLPEMLWGNKATDGGYLILDSKERDDFLASNPESKKFIKKYIGSQEFIKGIERWCLWISDSELAEAKVIKDVDKRIKNVRKIRLESKAKSTRNSAKISHRFIQIQHEPAPAIIIPSVSSEVRRYIPIGFVKDDVVVNAQCYVVYNPESWIFGVISSRMHMTWVRAVAGRLKTDYRYSSALCYNTFPISPLTTKQKEILTRHTYNILEEREKHSEKTIAQLYDPDKMPAGLKEAHHSLDLAVERIYRSKPFKNDEERLEYLFKLYERMVGEKNGFKR